MSSRLLQILNPAHSAENVDDLFLENGRDRLQVLLTCYLFMPRLRLGNVGRHTCITIISDVRVLTLTHKSEPKNTVPSIPVSDSLANWPNEYELYLYLQLYKIVIHSGTCWGSGSIKSFMKKPLHLLRNCLFRPGTIYKNKNLLLILLIIHNS